MTHTNRLGWKLFTDEQLAREHAKRGGVSIYQISDSTNAFLFANNMTDFRKAVLCLGIREKKIRNAQKPVAMLVGVPLQEALRKCKE